MQSVALTHDTTQATTTQTEKTPQEISTPNSTPKSNEVAKDETHQNGKKSTKTKQAKDTKAKSNKKAKKSTQNEEVAQKAQTTEISVAEKSPADSIPNNPTNSTNPRHTDDTELAQILSYSHLPIRIKITNPNTLLKRIKVQIHLSNLGQILVRLPENNRVARRYIHALFGSNILYEVDNEFCISAVGYTESMWEGVMELISSRIIHNIALDFEFNTKKSDSSHYAGFGESGEGFETFLTREEYLLRKCYSELNVDFRDDFAKVKKQYLKLAKKFHPDNAQGKDKNTVEVFEERFKRILDAYNTIKASHAPHADKTTA
ncbi:J domain-containing protein [Helicobacter sp. MIT 01-3238]|uniref:J domain-containing protein n=1 Tax=Helicobacter sp. MIT 01-3238 TaxID=398627 RepID=UPI00286951C9|nr:J domain-containing protein [Helicobacter sp. MIT 01-3238]